ncbi:alpha/beta hydrolase [Rhodococcus sp. IEGM 1381]|uniref:alpha/beta fold hydrolase n=1 Tax=Rhodococcus sp. IEGM 1381 TaxID=3047085 RepID=UPI0024B681EF|nr:alpha/beta hydrolase [Rhodococcus sp. IEGM 1381]MDI9897381.1 alpha/beta hydrolase [Rhodococcus sp. IEGM 1381]
MTKLSALEDPTNAPDLLLVHGAWHGPWAWDLLIPHLPGVVRTVALPSSGAEPSALGGHAEDVDAIRTALAENSDRPTVVVAHSGSGLSTTRAVCGQQHVVGVVYVAALVADVGQRVADLFEGPPPTWWDLHPEEGYVDARTPLPTFYNDVPTDIAESCAARLTHQSLAGDEVELTDAAWRHMPTAYVICDHDRAIAPSVQEQMAKHSVRVHHLPSGHSPFLSMPDALATVIRSESEEFMRVSTDQDEEPR